MVIHNMLYVLKGTAASLLLHLGVALKDSSEWKCSQRKFEKTVLFIFFLEEKKSRSRSYQFMGSN